MHTYDRKAAWIAVLLGTFMLLALSACGRSDSVTFATQPTTVATGPATATPVPTLISEASGTAAGATDSVTTTTEATPSTTPMAATTTPDSATATAAAIADTDPFTGTDVLTDTENVSVTVELSGTQTLITTQPVAIAIADAFVVPVSQVIALHEDGLGFGEIARAYFLARELAADSDLANDLTAEQILAMHQGGLGWGQIVVTLGLPHGNSGRNLGLIMRAHKDPAQTTVIVAPTGAELDDDHGPASPPPGQTKHDDNGNGKDKQHGNGNGNGHGNGKGNSGGKKDK